MNKIVRWREDDNFDKKDFGAFMRELAIQTKKLDDEKSSEIGTLKGLYLSLSLIVTRIIRLNLRLRKEKINKRPQRKMVILQRKKKKKRKKDEEFHACLYEPCRKKCGRNFLKNVQLTQNRRRKN